MTPSSQKCGEKQQGSSLRLFFTYLCQNLLYIKKHLALVLKKIVNVLLSVLQTNLNKAVNIYYTLPKWIGNMKMMHCFSTIKTWMRIMHGRLRRLKNQNMIKKLYSPPSPHYTHTKKSWYPPPPPPPTWLNFLSLSLNFKTGPIFES